MIEALRHTRGYGVAEDKLEFLPGVMGVGAVLRDYLGSVLSSLGCKVPQDHRDKDHLQALKYAVMECAASRAENFGRTHSHRGILRRE